MLAIVGAVGATTLVFLLRVAVLLPARLPPSMLGGFHSHLLQLGFVLVAFCGK